MTRHLQHVDVDRHGDGRSADRAAFSIAPGVLLAGIAGGLAFPILPAVGIEQHLPALMIGAILAANRIGRIVAGPLVGAATDRLGGRALLLSGLVGQLVVMVLYLLAVTTPYPAAFFLLGRLLHGPLSACVFVGAQALALHAGGRERGGIAAGTVKASMSLGLPLGVLIGGLVSGRIGASGVFLGSIAALLLASATAFAWTPRTASRAPAKARLTEVIAALADRRLAVLGALNFAVTFSALGVVLTALPLVVGTRAQGLLGLSAKSTAAALMGVLVVFMAMGTLVSSRAAKSTRAHAQVCLASAVALPLALAMMAVAASSSAAWLAAVALLGLAAGALSASVTSLLSRHVAPAHLGAGTGWLQLCGDLGGVSGPLVASALLGVGATAAWLGAAAVLLIFVPVALTLRFAAVTGARPLHERASTIA